MKKAVFLDKDGTVIEDVPYGINPKMIRFAAGASEALTSLHQAGYLLIIISNQSGIARGYFREEDLAPVEAKLREMCEPFGVPLSGFYYCPHLPEGVIEAYSCECDCRKPESGLLIRAAKDHGIELEQSWMIGDILHDIAAGRKAGCRTVLIDNGNETEWVLSRGRLPHHIVGDLAEAARIILACDHAVSIQRHEQQFT
jgi:D-glycero-D-manno-heptose 1,7-bisphosphate phosphatase